jgi:hypothetical protein
MSDWEVSLELSRDADRLQKRCDRLHELLMRVLDVFGDDDWHEGPFDSIWAEKANALIVEISGLRPASPGQEGADRG